MTFFRLKKMIFRDLQDQIITALCPINRGYPLPVNDDFPLPIKVNIYE